jgi:general secretion pathway protein I
MRSADRPAPAPKPRASGTGGFTLLELVLALTIFALIVVNVLADREKSIRIAGEAEVMQTVRYLAQSKIDEIRHDPSQYGDSDSGDFTDDDLQTDWQRYDFYTWSVEIERMVAVGTAADDQDATYLFDDDKDATPPQSADGKAIPPRYVRRVKLTVNYAPAGEPLPSLSILIVTFIPDDAEAQKQ